MTRNTLRFSALLVIAFGALSKMWAQSAPSAQSAPVFTATQSDAGGAAYSQNCASCHGDNLDDGHFAPALRGRESRTHWAGKTLEELFTYTSTKMPPDRAGGLESRTYIALLAYVLESNGLQPGDKELATDPEQLRAIKIPNEILSNQQRLRVYNLGVAGGTPLPSWPAAPNPLDKIAPVTDAMLRNPSPGDWLTWGRTYDDLGFSPLKQSTKRM
jgi:alcohol dehydrogenase (cytochrome c)